MKNRGKILATLRGFTSTINRFPVSIMFFVLFAILTTYDISIGYTEGLDVLFRALILGASVSLVMQMIYEHFYEGLRARLVFGGLSVLVAILYYSVVELLDMGISTEHDIRLVVIMFILLVAFIWLPTIKSSVAISESFMVVFKSFFMVVLYSVVLYLGISLIIMAINMLLFEIDSDLYRHAFTLVSYIYAPIHFLSLIPVYAIYSAKLEHDDSVEQEEAFNEDDSVNKIVEISRFLSGLVSYIIIPVTAIFTIILLLYIILNITGDFWKDNLMESLLVAYSITVIVVYLLASVMPSKAAQYFRKIFPKVLIPVVLFQTISSILKIGELGITSGRYYVIMFGIFASICAIIFSLRPNHKNNVIAPILIIFSLISILPPVDAFTISKRDQINRLTKVLEQNDMLKDNKIIANPNLAEEDREIIINSVGYLSGMDFSKDISWLQSYSVSYDFEGTFGFPMYGSSISDSKSYNYYLIENAPISLSGYDVFVELSVDNNRNSFDTRPWGDKGYYLVQDKTDTIGDLIVKDENDNELLRFSLNEVSDRFKEMGQSHRELTLEEAEFLTENENAIFYMVVKSFNLDIWGDSEYQNIVAYIMVKIK